MNQLLAFLCILASLGAGSARADSDSAAAAYFEHRERLHYDNAARSTSVARADTLVKGVYRLEDRASGRFIALITERGDLKGDSEGWSRVGPEGPVPLTTAELAQLRAEVMRNIAWEQLIEDRYGRGGGRRLILLSAVNCPFCENMEANLARMAASLDTTFYVLPSSLIPLPNAGAGLRTWQQAAALRCAKDPGTAWRRFWTHRTVPNSAGCAMDAEAAHRSSRNFGTVLASIGTRVSGTPAVIREDGARLSVPPDMDLAYVTGVYGPAGLPAGLPAPGTQPVWLVAPQKGAAAN
jgi:hypothetical protein